MGGSGGFVKSFVNFTVVFAAIVSADVRSSGVYATRPLYVGGLFELSDHWWIPYTSFFPTVVEYAFEHINNRTDILRDYELKLLSKDTKGKNGLAAKRLTELVLELPPKVAIIGPGLSDEVTITGQIAPFYKITELSYTATTATTADHSLFPTLLTVNQIMNALNPLRMAMMKHFGWSRVGTLFFQDEMSVSQMNLFHDLLRQENKTLVTSAVISETNMETVIKRFKQYDVRVIFGVFRSRIAPEIFCEVFKQGLYGERTVWVLAGPYMYPNWISGREDMSSAGCTKEELIVATNGHFTLDYVKISKYDSPTYTGMLPSEIMDTLSVMAKQTPYKLSSFAGLVYDTGIALALGLNNSIKYLQEKGLDLADYNYTDDYLDAVLKGIHEVSFMGVSGPITFDDFGQRIGITYIQQNFHDTRIDVASYDSISDNLTWLVSSDSLWPDGIVPEDHFTYEVYPAPASVAAFGSIVTLSAVGCILAFVFLGFNIHYRNKRFIKMSSPKLNNLIIGGCLLLYCVVLIGAVDYQNLTDAGTSEKLCMVRAWVMSLGFTTLFGTLFSKTYRVYAIFRESIHQKKSIKDYHLFGVVGLLLVVDCLFLIPWTAMHALTQKKMVKNTKDDLNNNVIFSEVYAYCHHDYQNYWFAAVYIYKGLLLAFGTFLAWETRNVKVIALNDSKYIGFCIYNVVVVCVFGVPLDHAMPIDQTTLTFLMESGLIIYTTTACLCILFIPKIRAMNKIQGTFLMSDMNPSQTGSDRVTTIDTKVSAVNQKQEADVSKLKMQLAGEAIAIAKLKKRLLEVTGNVHFYKSGSEYVVFKRNNSNLEHTDELRSDLVLEDPTSVV